MSKLIYFEFAIMRVYGSKANEASQLLICSVLVDADNFALSVTLLNTSQA